MSHMLESAGGFAVPSYVTAWPGWRMVEMTPEEKFRYRLENSRSEDADTPEGWYFAERFGETCEDRW